MTPEIDPLTTELDGLLKKGKGLWEELKVLGQRIGGIQYTPRELRDERLIQFYKEFEAKKKEYEDVRTTFIELVEQIPNKLKSGEDQAGASEEGVSQEKSL